MDSEDEEWFDRESRDLQLKQLTFERIMETLEESSREKVISLREAQTLLKVETQACTAVYDYWLNKRLATVDKGLPSRRR